MDKAEDKALVYTEETMQGTHTIEKNTKKAKEIKNSDKKSVMFITN
jgi:hypothetical protein